MDLLNRIKTVFPHELKQLRDSARSPIGINLPLQRLVRENLTFLEQLLNQGLHVGDLAAVLEAAADRQINSKTLACALAREKVGKEHLRMRCRQKVMSEVEGSSFTSPSVAPRDRHEPKPCQNVAEVDAGPNLVCLADQFRPSTKSWSQIINLAGESNALLPSQNQ